MSRKTLVLLAMAALLLVISAILIGGCTSTTVPASSSSELKKFNSPEEISDYLKNATQLAQDSYTMYDTGARNSIVGTAVPVVQKSSESGVSVPASLPSAAGIGSPDYSATNVQVAGVDEPDFVKNDARYIYVISGSTLAIVDAYPATTASVISRTDLEDSPREIFVNGDRLVLLSTGYSETQATGASAPDTPQKMIAGVAVMPKYPVYRSSPVTHAVFYDISDRTHPKVFKDYTIDGDYVNARMTGTTIYLLSRESVYPYNERIIVPAVYESRKLVATPDVYYFDNPEPQYDFTTVTSFDVGAGITKDTKTFLVGSGNILYVSPDAMYVSYQQYHNIYRPQMGIAVPAPVVVPVSAGAGASIARVSTATVPDFNTMSETEKQAVISGLRNGEQDAIRNQEIAQTTTIIHKIGIKNGEITYLSRGEVPGVLKDQFSMDEFNGNLRVATTSDIYSSQGQYEYNSVFVLDGSLKTAGSLTHIAEQEKIYSTRFVGDRLYMVTFKRIDPFFVIDLSDPASPKILGKLKIPGYSDYLHPYDSTHIIGIGKETATNDWGGVSTKGLKLALFDVADVEHPKQLGNVEIGDAGSDSAALSDHRAFLFDKGKNLLVIPARVVRQAGAADSKGTIVQPQVWYGAYVFGITPETGFVLRGTVEHGTSSSGYYYYGSSQDEVKRSLYIGDTLYTLSQNKILANSLNNISTTLATIRLPDGGSVLYPPMMNGIE